MPRSYVNNSMNRSLGRVGMSVGSMPVSRGSSSGGSGGGFSFGGNSSGYSSSMSSSSKTYVDNASNRSIGRVGMPVGSMPVSKGSGSVGSEGGHSSSSSGFSFGGNSSGYSSSMSSSSKTNVDNASNRSIGRVGMPVGSMPVSKGSSSVGSEGGHSSSSSGFSFGGNSSGYSNSTSSSSKTYVDNVMNRSVGRVGMPVGSMPVSRGSSSSGGDDRGSSSKQQVQSPSASAAGTRTYVDNTYNRRHGRVGLPVGSIIISKKGETKDPSSDTKTYADNAYNKTHGRAGFPFGSKVISKKSDKSSSTTKTREVIENKEREQLLEWFDDTRLGNDGAYDDEMKNSMLQALHHKNRQFEEMMLKKLEQQLTTTAQVLEEYKGKTVPFDELKLASKIGSGGFGEVYFAKMKGSVVAVKRLKAETVSKRRLDEFVKEMMIFCKLDHVNIVKFVGACIERPNLCIVMEYMQMSLFDAIHIRDDIDITETQRLDIIRQTCNGLMYLHNADIVHRDLKTSNVLIDYLGEKIEVKITDFGLSSMKGNIGSSSSYGGEIIGTPRYSAPEILRGGRGLTVEDYKKADVYSLSLVLFEVVFEDEPFYDFNLHQLVKCVGENGALPEVPDDPAATENVMRVMEMAWSFKPEDRQNIAQLCDVFKAQKTLYDASELLEDVKLAYV